MIYYWDTDHSWRRRGLWFKILKRWKWPPLIKARASSTKCTVGNLTCSRPRQHIYIQSMLNLARFISFLLCKSLIKLNYFLKTTQ
jgi:hypothetical protein